MPSEVVYREGKKKKKKKKENYSLSCLYLDHAKNLGFNSLSNCNVKK